MDHQESRRIHWFMRGMVLPAVLFVCGCAALDFRHAQPADTRMDTVPDRNASSPETDNPQISEAPAPEIASVEPPRMLMPKPLPPAKRQPARKAKEPPQPPLPLPNVAIGDLIGSDFTSILHVFRFPDTVQNNALSVVWIYSPPGCTLQLFFYPDIETTRFHLLKYDLKNTAGEVLATGDPCMQRILAPRSAGAASP